MPTDDAPPDAPAGPETPDELWGLWLGEIGEFEGCDKDGYPTKDDPCVIFAYRVRGAAEAEAGIGRCVGRDHRPVWIGVSPARLEAAEKALAALVEAARAQVRACPVCRGEGSIELRKYDAASGEMEWDGFGPCHGCRTLRRAIEEAETGVDRG